MAKGLEIFNLLSAFAVLNYLLEAVWSDAEPTFFLSRVEVFLPVLPWKG